MDITIEVSNNKWPAASAVHGHWEENMQALFLYAREVLEANHVVVQSPDGAPIEGALVSVMELFDAPSVTSNALGHAYRLIHPYSDMHLFRVQAGIRCFFCIFPN